MKKIIYLLFALTVVFTACEPLEDVYEELDAINEGADAIVGDDTIILSEDDYEALGLSDGYFTSRDQVEELIPDYLAELYPVWGNKSSVVVTYNLEDLTSYTVSDEDYTELGLESLTSDDDFEAFFTTFYPSEEQGKVVELTYMTEPTINAYTLTDEDYELVGNGQYDNFDIREGRDEELEEVRRAKIQTILLNNNPDAALGTIYEITYEIYDGSTSNLTMTVELEENDAPSNTVEYTLTDEDFDLVGNGYYDNFDVREGRDEETEEARREKIAVILDYNFPDAVIGDFYNVTYAIYDGSAGELEMLLELTTTGWTIYSSLSYNYYEYALVEAVTKYAYTGTWSAPVTFTADEYTYMGQSYPNFSNTEEAEYNIGIYLESLYPFAKVDDFVAVEYDYFSGGVSQKNVNFIFDGSTWNVASSTLQFSHNGTVWEPDNTIKYTLTESDYALVGNDRYNNFDVRSGRDEETEEVRLAKINTILLNNFPDDVEGQKYLVTYNVYSGSNEVWEMAVIKSGDVYIIQE